MRSFLFLLGLGILAAPLADSAGADPWQEILHVQDGRFNVTPRLVHSYYPSLRVVYRSQFHTNGNTRQIGAATNDFVDPWVVGDITSYEASKELPDLAVSALDVAHVIWREYVGPLDPQILYVNDAGGSWSTPRQLTTGGPQKHLAVIARQPALNPSADTTGVVHIAYATAVPGALGNEIHYFAYDAFADSILGTVQVTNDGLPDREPAIAVDSDGTVYLSWIRGISSEGEILCAAGGLAGFVELPTGVTASATRTDIAVGDAGPHIVYRHSVSDDIKVVRHIRYTGTSFTAPLDVSPSDAFYGDPSLVVTSPDIPTVAFRSNTTGLRGLYVALWNGAGFDPPETVHADEALLYQETDLGYDPFRVGLPGRDLGALFGHVTTSTSYIEADSVRADIRVFQGLVAATDAPPPGPAGPLALGVQPNPFRSATTLTYSVRERGGRVVLDVYDVTGRRVDRILDRTRPVGTYREIWTAPRLPAGVYWLRLQANAQTETRKVLHLR